MKFKIGESVAVKFGVTDPDFGFDISGWQGRVEEVDNTDTMFIRWDSLTLNGTGFGNTLRRRKFRLGSHDTYYNRSRKGLHSRYGS